tara:strand:- start:31 stop:717 length:687 start_codon:yes stop_codon:yes gene_type:complete
MSHERIIEIFDDWASTGRAEGMERGHGNAVAQVLPQMDVRAGMVSLDLGCGNGWATRMLSTLAPGASAIGIDAAPAMVKRAEELHDLTTRARYEVCTFEAIDFNDDKFDRVFSMEALYYAVDLDQAIAEIHRVLKPGGAAHILIDRFAESPQTKGWSDVMKVDMAWLPEAEWAAKFRAAGFEDVSTKRVIDSRGPGDEAEFVPGEHYATWQDRVELHEAGTLWIHAVK